MIKNENWLTPTNKVLWMKAFRSRAEHVELRDGRRFQIKYKTATFFPSDGPKEYAWVEPSLGTFAPSGYFSIERVTDQLWLTESDRPDVPESKYSLYLDEFIDSDVQGVLVTNMWPELRGRLHKTLQRAFTTAKAARGKKAEHVLVATDDNKVFLLKQEPSE